MNESILNKVTSLLRKAERTDNEHEALAFTAKAQELIARHAIDAALIDTDSPNGSQPAQVVFRKVRITGAYVPRRTSLACAVGKAVGTKPIILSEWDSEQHKAFSAVEFCGLLADVEWAEALYLSLSAQLDGALKQAQKTQKSSYEHGRSFGTGFVAGFTNRVAERLHEVNSKARKEAEQEREAEAPSAPGVALVLARKAEKVEQEFTSRYPRTQSVRRAAPNSRGGYRSGQAAGSSASFARGSAGQGRAKAVGR